MSGRNREEARALPVRVIVLAKRPVAGRVKTRLTPPYPPELAASLAAAALDDTLRAVSAAPVLARTLAFDGRPDGWLRPGYEHVRQRGDELADRLTAAFADAYARRPLPALLVGMDTPQLRPALLAAAARTLLGAATDAVLGPATDGGYWLAGLRRPHPRAFAGVPMSTSWTHAAQHARFERLGLRTALLPRLTDVDDAATAAAVAAAAPDTAFARLHATARIEVDA
ncbi:MAG TPA: TIGR04282 family arsenosugar biosynthesis glycosyltransferase [Streptosporangiales bacterium]